MLLRNFPAFGGLFCGLSLIVGLLAVYASGQVPDTERPAVSAADENYMIGPGDVIDVSVSKNDTLSRAGARVSDRGTIQLPMLDEDIPAACMTERQLADQIKEKYKKYVINPFINVSVREFNSNPVALIGAVQSPGRFQVQRPMRLLELLTFVNGPSSTAGRTIEIIRSLNRPYCEGGRLVTPDGTGDDLITLSLADTLKGEDAANPLVRAGDIIRVAQIDQINAYIQGNVNRSMTISLNDPVTLSEAVAMAGGLSSGAAAEKIVIRRQVPDSINRSEMIVNLKAINQGKRDDVLLQANDIVEVQGPSGSKKILNRIFDTLVPSIIGLPTRVIR